MNIFKCLNCGCEFETSLATKSTKCPNCSNSNITEIIKLLQSGTNFGDYKLISNISKGIIYELWIGKNISTSVKMFLKIYCSEYSKRYDIVNKLIECIKVAAKLKHQNIISPKELKNYNGMLVVACPYENEQNLQSKIYEEKCVAEQTALKIILDTAEALRYAWEKSKIKHLDLNPKDMLINDSDTVSLKLLNLGISERLAENSFFREDGSLIGSPYYISPEQVNSTEDVDFRSDIYSLGSILYHMITGRVPFQGANELDILAKRIIDDVKFDKDVEVADQVKALIRHMMSRNPKNRQQNWNQVIGDIRQVMDKSYIIAPADLESSFKSELSNRKGNEGNEELKLQEFSIPNQLITANNSDLPELTQPKKSFRCKIILLVTFIVIFLSVTIGAFIFINQKLTDNQGEGSFSTDLISKNIAGSESFRNTEVTINEWIDEIFYISDQNIGGPEFEKASISIKILILDVIIILFITFSAFWSAALAERDRRNRLLHFIIGAIIIILYPLIIYRVMTSSKKTKVKILSTKEELAELNKISHNVKLSKAKIFEKIIIDDSGKRTGPFQFIMKDGTTFKVLQVTDMKDNIAHVDMIISDAKIKKIRVPFLNIKKYSLLDNI